MAVNEGFKTFILEQLHLLPAVTSRYMFGGTGLYSEGLFFAIIADSTLYLKVDDTNRADYEDEGMGPLHPFDDDRSMNYWEVPVDVIEDRDRLAEWSGKALEIARRAAVNKDAKKKKRKKNRS